MEKYKIGFGLGGGYGGISDFEIHECETQEDAMDIAYELAVEFYGMFEGMRGLLAWGDCQDELREEYGEEPSDEEVTARYEEELETWLCYEVKIYDENEEGYEDEF